MSASVRSMTGYGSARFEVAGVTWLVELRSVNHRYLKLNFKTPSNLVSLQEWMRKTLSRAIMRGAVDVILRPSETNGNLYSLNESQIERYEKQLRERFPSFEPTPELLLMLPGSTTRCETTSDGEFAEALEGPFSAAIEAFNRYRGEEGKALVEDILARCRLLSATLDEIEKRASDVPREYAEKLTARLSEILRESGLDEPEPVLVAREAAVFADRSDITEETVRFRHHLDRLEKLMKRGGAVGKEADFIVQEMNREANTMGAKCSDLAISDSVISLKSELEKIREQVQNLE